MARIRAIKPEFCKHEGLYDLERESGLPVRLAFAGLWTCCDREGRFKWKPRQLKTDALPYDEVDFAEVLNVLWQAGYVQRYRVDGEDYGYIPSWHKHQVINNREAKSNLPAPSETFILQSVDASSTREARVEHATGTRLKGKGREGKGNVKELKPKPSPQTPAEVLPQDSWHQRIKALVRSAWSEHNGGTECPWGVADSAQLKLMRSKSPGWSDSQYAQCLVNMYGSQGFPRSKLPFEFLPRLCSYLSGPRNEFNREQGNGQVSKAEQRSRRIREATERAFGISANDSGSVPGRTLGSGIEIVGGEPVSLPAGGDSSGDG